LRHNRAGGRRRRIHRLEHGPCLHRGRRLQGSAAAGRVFERGRTADGIAADPAWRRHHRASHPQAGQTTDEEENRSEVTPMPRVGNPLLLALCAGLLAACGDMGNKDAAAATTATATPAVEPDSATGFVTTELARFDSPWAMTFLPDGRLLVTEMGGTLKLFDPASGATGVVSGVPTVVHRGQGGFGDVMLHPRFADNHLVYISYVEAGEGGTGSAVARARLALDDAGGGALENLQVIWRQVPKMDGNGHFGQRIAFGPDGMLYISSSERQKFDPAQDMSMNLGKIVRLNDEGSVPADNPFVAQGGVAAQVWTLGHRNVLGLAFDGNGQLWAHEMGPRGGDEFNRIEKGTNYGYPLVSEGN